MFKAHSGERPEVLPGQTKYMPIWLLGSDNRAPITARTIRQLVLSLLQPQSRTAARPPQTDRRAPPLRQLRTDGYGRNWRHGIEECSNARPCRVGFGGPDRHCPGRHSRCHIRMHNHSTGRCLIECRRITSIVQKTHFIRASRLQGSHTFEEQFEFIRNPACRTRNNCKRIWPSSTKEPCIAQSCFDHPHSH